MIRQEFCHTCKQKNDCRRVYRDLGHIEGPPVAAKVVLAFLLPLLVFIVSLWIFERILAGAIHKGHVVTSISFLLALLITFACIMMIKVIRRWSGQGG